ncbi:DNA polymerase III subunit delta' [bacterium]|nr:DNA polymerase III subunit delta' [bacterium]
MPTFQIENKIYRFDQVIGQERLISTLARGVHSGHFPHAYLFLGQPGTGKEAVALDLAKILLCLGESDAPKDVIPCGSCASCAKMKLLKHPNLKILFPLPKPKSSDDEDASITFNAAHQKEIDAVLDKKATDYYTSLSVSGGQEILLQHIRTLRHEFSMTSYSGKWRVVLISQADRLRVQAANAFLKLLEEPPPGIVFILTSDRESRLLPTIVSRCQILRFAPLQNDLLSQQLQTSLNIPEDQADLSARLANGSWLEAKRWAKGNPEEEMQKIVDLFRLLLRGDPGEIDIEIDKLSGSSSSSDLKQLLPLMTSWLQDVQRYDAAPERYSDIGKQDALVKFAKFCQNRNFESAVEELESARLDLERHVSPALVLHQLFTRLQSILFTRGTSTMKR